MTPLEALTAPCPKFLIEFLGAVVIGMAIQRLHQALQNCEYESRRENWIMRKAQIRAEIDRPYDPTIDDALAERGRANNYRRPDGSIDQEALMAGIRTPYMKMNAEQWREHIARGAK